MRYRVVFGAAALVLVAGVYLFARGHVAVIRGCSSTITELEKLQAMPFRDNLYGGRRTPTDFDANVYFQVLNHLSMRQGYALDYVYEEEGEGGTPLLYARPVAQRPYETVDEFIIEHGGRVSDHIWAGDQDYLHYLNVVDTPEGYFQFTVLRWEGERFYRWGLARYLDVTIVCDSKTRDEILALPAKSPNNLVPFTSRQIAAVKALNLNPHVRTLADRVLVDWIGFNQYTGFSQYTLVISRGYSHAILQQQIVNLVPYDSGSKY